MRCTADDVFEVFADGWLFGLWVVGASRIRSVDRTWPAIGACINLSVGAWPLLIKDTTRLLAYRSGSRLRLHVTAWPAGEAIVDIEVEPLPTGCRVSITEDAISGPGLLFPQRLRQCVLHWRNVETLRRLGYLAQGRVAEKEVVA